MTKVLIVTYEFPPAMGGIGRYLFNLGYGLSVKSTYIVTILTPQGQVFSCKEAEVKPLLNHGRLKDFITITKTILNGKFDIVIWGHSRTFLYASMLSNFRRIIKFKSLVPLYGSELLKFYKKSIYSAYSNMMFNKSDMLIPISQFTYTLLPDDYQSKARVVYPAIHDDWFQERDVIKERRDAPTVFGTLSRLVKRKGHSKVLECLSRLKKDSEFTYIIGGDGPEMSNIKSLVKEYGLEKNVHMLGRLPEEDIVGFYDSIDVFIMLNKVESDDVEGFGYTFVEAGARGVASIGGKNGGAKEVIRNNETGLLVDIEDDDEIMFALKYAIDNHAEWDLMGDKCKKIYHESYSLNIMAEAYNNIIETVMRRS